MPPAIPDTSADRHAVSAAGATSHSTEHPSTTVTTPIPWRHAAPDAVTSTDAHTAGTRMPARDAPADSATSTVAAVGRNAATDCATTHTSPRCTPYTPHPTAETSELSSAATLSPATSPVVRTRTSWGTVPHAESSRHTSPRTAVTGAPTGVGRDAWRVLRGSTRQGGTVTACDGPVLPVGRPGVVVLGLPSLVDHSHNCDITLISLGSRWRLP